jgi:hypothetical protein
MLVLKKTLIILKQTMTHEQLPALRRLVSKSALDVINSSNFSPTNVSSFFAIAVGTLAHSSCEITGAKIYETSIFSTVTETFILFD